MSWCCRLCGSAQDACTLCLVESVFGSVLVPGNSDRVQVHTRTTCATVVVRTGRSFCLSVAIIVIIATSEVCQNLWLNPSDFSMVSKLIIYVVVTSSCCVAETSDGAGACAVAQCLRKRIHGKSEP